ncbi:MIOREX complex component 8 [[Candida] anglica]|uniref:MIOREX complex component 8 n=1 Tax=[Candida] anglica TaxID=148631 RepID=A0ABP0EBK0_9ASCO
MFCSRVLRVKKSSIDYLLSSLPVEQVVAAAPTSTVHRPIKLPPRDPLSLLISPEVLTAHFHHEGYQKPSSRQISQSQNFFGSAKIKLDWTHNQYSDIPDVKHQRLDQERQIAHEKREAYHRPEISKKSFGIKPDLLKPLPEVLFLGNTNVGKSTLVNTLFLDKQSSKNGASTEFAYVSRRAGYTKTLNCFNVNNKLRIIDTPGYGQFGETSQGTAVMEYIEKRKVLRAVYVLVDGVKGFSELDNQIIDLLIDQGISFDVIFTKLDQVIKSKVPRQILSLKNLDKLTKEERINNAEMADRANEAILNHFEKIIQDAELRDVATLPRIFFNNSVASQVVPKRYGYMGLRVSILQSCGLVSEESEPSKKIDEIKVSQVGTNTYDPANPDQFLEDLEVEDVKKNKGRRKRVVRRLSGRTSTL